MRLTGAAVASYVVAKAIFPGTQPLTGPLTALLVVQVTLFSTLTTGLRRVLSVVSGVLVAVVFSSVVGLTWWSLGAVVAASIVIGQLLRLREHLLEVPISAMLVLGVGSAETAAAARLTETLIGAAVGVLINVVFPPPLRSRDAGEAVERVALEAAGVLERVADELPAGASTEQAAQWLADFRRIQTYVVRADQSVEAAGDSRRLNPRAVGTLDPQPVLRSGLDALEHSTVSLRALFRSIVDGVGEGQEGYDEELRGAFAVLLLDLAGCLRAFGALVRAEAGGGREDGVRPDGAGDGVRPDGARDDVPVDARPGGAQGRLAQPPLAQAPLAEALETLRETRARLTEFLLVDPQQDSDLWELRGSLLAAVARVLAELDVKERSRQRERWLRDAGARSRASQAVLRLRNR